MKQGNQFFLEFQIEDENGNAIDDEDEFEEEDFSEGAEFNDDDVLIDEDSFDD